MRRKKRIVESRKGEKVLEEREKGRKGDRGENERLFEDEERMLENVENREP